MSKADQIIRDLPTAVIRWYPFESGSTLLYLGKEDAVFSALSEMQLGNATVFDMSICSIEEEINDSTSAIKDSYRYIVISTALFEKSTDPTGILSWCVAHLEQYGVILFAIHNRFGIRYFCGDRDFYTEKVFDGINDYRGLSDTTQNTAKGRTYGADKIKKMLDSCGLSVVNRYSVMPGLENPSIIYADGYIPNEKMISRLFPEYHSPDTVFLNEKELYDDLLNNDMFHQMANAYMYECVKKSEQIGKIHVSDALQITSSLNRGPEKAIITVIHSDKTVTKMAAYPEGVSRIRALADNMKRLRERGIDTVDGSLKDDVYVMPYIEAETGEMYLKRLLQYDRELYLKKMDEFRVRIIKSSESYEGIFISPVPVDENDKERLRRMEHVPEEWESKPVQLLRNAYIDMVPLNSFYLNGKFVFFDQEMCEKDLPVDYIMHRTLLIVHGYLTPEQQLVSMKEMFQRYGIPDGQTGDTEEKRRYFVLDDQLMRNLKNERLLADYYNNVRSKPDVINYNRAKINAPVKDNIAVFEELFIDIGDKKLIIFGAGDYAKAFFTKYGNNYPVVAAVDNSEDKWNTYLYAEGYEPDKRVNGRNIDDDLKRTIEGGHCVKVVSPKYLQELKYGDYRVIICIKNYEPVIRQLNEMGIYDFGVYNPYRQYRRELRPIKDTMYNVRRTDKKYNIGYTAGAFDMFHTGHVNLIRRSKEMCDYLIVGVMSDEAIRNFKGKEPCIPYNDRVAVVASCRYVDEVVEIPYMRGNSDTAWEKYHFDVQFCGSDYIGNDGRMKEKEFLEAHGAVLEILPYTEHISSTKIRAKLKD